MLNAYGGVAMSSARNFLTSLLRPAAVLAAFLLAAPAQATLMQRDLATAGDNLLAYDSDTNFEWLHFSLTANMGYQSIVSQLGTLGGGGFRFATLSEVSTLYGNAGFDPVGAVNSTDPDDLAAASLLHDLLGTTAVFDTRGGGFAVSSFNRYQEGWVLPDSTTDPLVYLATIWITDQSVTATGQQISLSASTDVGTLSCHPGSQCGGSTWDAGGYLVRTAASSNNGGTDIPAPPTLPLLAAGLGLLALQRTRRR